VVGRGNVIGVAGGEAGGGLELVTVLQRVKKNAKKKKETCKGGASYKKRGWWGEKMGGGMV